jgi:hypothetical protein
VLFFATARFVGATIRSVCGCAPAQFHKHFYILSLGSKSGRKEYLDATRKGSPTRYLNHSCDPNAATELWCVCRWRR